MKVRNALVTAIAVAMLSTSWSAVSAPSASAASAFAPSTLAASTAHVGTAYVAALSNAIGSTWSVVSGEIPPGLSLSPAGQISGVPTLGGAYTFVVQASSATGTARKAYTILVNLPASTGYDSRMHAVIFARDAAPDPRACNKTSDLTYAMADLWLNRNPADVNKRLAALRFSHFGGDPSACSSNSDQARNNLKLALLVRPYMLYNPSSSYFPGRLGAAASNNLVAQMWSYAKKYSKFSNAADAWAIYDSENHDAAAEGFYFMAAQIFKDSPAYRNRRYNDGHTVAQQYKAWHDHWSNYLDQRAKRGLFIEVASPIYHQYSIQAVLNIYNFADDPVLRKKAGMLLDIDFADYAQQQLNSIEGGAKSRSYPSDSFDGTPDGMTNTGRLLWSTASTSPSDNTSLMFATSGYSPSPVVQSIATNHAALGNFEYITRRPGGGRMHSDSNGNQHPDPLQSVLNYAYVTPDYVMGTTERYPDQSEIAPSAQNRWQGIIFNSGGGAARIYPQTAPLQFSHTYDAFNSIQKKNVLITEKQAYGANATLVYFPSTLTRLAERGGWLFAEQGDSYVAVTPGLGHYRWLTAKKNKVRSRAKRFITLTNHGAPIIFEAGRAADYGTFAAFQTRILHNRLTRTKTVVNYTGSSGARFSMSTNPEIPATINGHHVDYAPRLGFNSPYMKSVWGSGKISIQFGSQRATYDFSHASKPTEVVQ